MPDYVRNKLTFKCNSAEIRERIKRVIFIENSRNEQILTMQKMLPMPKEFSNSTGYTEYGYNWCISIWGSKWEVLNSKITESGDTFSIAYLTATDSNAKWVNALCRYIEVMSFCEDQNSNLRISVTHLFFRLNEDFGCKMEWTPETGFKYMEGEKLCEPI